ncbi:transcription termination factor NusG [Escherichia coli]|nr:transcription termination factor NusG [Escherichia coli]EFI9529082.1 transcription termination factor NusG [Escherichia coli]EFK7925345.1 transcription termination factor NusG [Escherichia coli]EFK7980175.1 transcription termination factor NusG [Escherichia coli]
MTTEQISDYRWYLARHITAGKKREALFGWLSDRDMYPWTPLYIRMIRRTDTVFSFRRQIAPVFPGYFFLKADFNIHSVSAIRQHTAFIDFVRFGNRIPEVHNSIVDGLMMIYPDPAPDSGVCEALDTASDRLTPAQYQYLLHLEDLPRPVSRISMLLELVQKGLLEQ